MLNFIVGLFVGSLITILFAVIPELPEEIDKEGLCENENTE